MFNIDVDCDIDLLIKLWVNDGTLTVLGVEHKILITRVILTGNYYYKW